MAETKKRVRKPKSAATVRITIVREEWVWKQSRDYRKISDDPGQKQYDYVDAILPQKDVTSLLEQTMPESKFDLGKVIKALNGL